MENNIFEGKKVLILGGSGGIGKAISLAIAPHCTELIIHGSKMTEKFSSLIDEIKSISQKNVKPITYDFFSESFEKLDSSPLFKTAENCDVLCVCFGPFLQKSIHETSLKDWESLSLYNYALPGALISKALPNMIKNNFGRILLFGGTGTSHRSEFATNAAYAGAKSALNILASSVAASYAKYGITCNVILPGFTDTEYIPDKIKSDLSSKMPLSSMISTKTIAETALFLLKNADINGTLLRLDQGWTPLNFLK